MKRKLGALAIGGAMVAAVPALAQTTISAGTPTIDLGGGWRSDSNVIGKDGYFLAGAQGKVLKPGFVGSFSVPAPNFPGILGYALIDNPETTPGTTPTKILSGTLNPFPATTTTAPFSFTMLGAVPQAIRVGVMIDNLDIAAYNPAAVALVGGGANSGAFSLSGASYNNRKPDWVFFDILGATDGQTFSVQTTRGINGCACLGGVSFDVLSAAAVPEPATWAMMIVGFGAVGATMRRRARQSVRVTYA